MGGNSTRSAMRSRAACWRARSSRRPARATRGHTHEKNCLNCGTQLIGPYCSACGQKAHVHRSVRAFFQDFVQGLFNFEGKIWRTLPMLAWRPGDMTRRYIAGERARFISPVALYLFTVFAMFAVLNFTGDAGNGNGKELQGRPEDRDRRRPSSRSRSWS